MADQRQNPKNEVSPLFKKLTKMFSGPLVNYKSQIPRNNKKRKLDKHGSDFRSLEGYKFKRRAYNAFDNLNTKHMNQIGRAERYSDFDQMEFYPLLHSAMDIYADEMTTHNELVKLLKIDCPNDEIKDVLDVLFYNVLNINDNLFEWCRTMCKNGDFFMYLDVNDDMGVKNVIGLPPEEIERLEGEDQTNANYVQFQWNAGGLTFENWQIAHFRILGNDRYAPYGTSVLEGARRIWRQLTMMEDAMMAYRIVRAPERRVFKINVSGIPDEDVEQFVQSIITNTKRHQVVDPDSGRVDLRYNPLGVEEDIYLPFVEGSEHSIDVLPSGQNTAHIEDVEYLKNMLLSAIKIPKAYLSMGDDGGEDGSTLSQKDIRFARTIQRLQRNVVAQLEKIAIVHLFTLGYRGEDVISFTLSLNNPSKLSQLQELEHWRTKLEVGSSAKESFFSEAWVARNIFNLSDDEFERNHYEKFSDKKFEMQIAAIEKEPNFAGGGHGTSLGGAGAGGEIGDEFATGTTLSPEAEETEMMGSEEMGGDAAPAAEEEKSPLLAAPGEEAPAKRVPDGYTTTLRSKGKNYKPAISDRRKSSGPREKNYRAMSGTKTSLPRATTTKNFSRVQYGLMESKDTIYSKLLKLEQRQEDILENHKDEDTTQ
jgi:hypothetical protein